MMPINTQRSLIRLLSVLSIVKFDWHDSMGLEAFDRGLVKQIARTAVGNCSGRTDPHGHLDLYPSLCL